jgi:hypothetical protein
MVNRLPVQARGRATLVNRATAVEVGLWQALLSTGHKPEDCKPAIETFLRLLARGDLKGIRVINPLSGLMGRRDQPGPSRERFGRSIDEMVKTLPDHPASPLADFEDGPAWSPIVCVVVDVGEIVRRVDDLGGRYRKAVLNRRAQEGAGDDKSD